MKKIMENEELAKVVGGEENTDNVVYLPPQALEHIPEVALENGPFATRIPKGGGGRPPPTIG